MKYLKFTYVDAVTGISIASHPATNGPVFPPVAGLEFAWARESRYPTDVPEFFGTCPDGSDTQIDGVLGVYSQADWETMRADEMAARDRKRASEMQITRLAFRNRFTSQEKVTLELAATGDPSAPEQDRQMAAMLRTYLADVATSSFIDLSRADTRTGVTFLESSGLLSTGRATEILDTPPTADERLL